MSDNGELRPQFWVLRPGTNTMVPLIALDELPPTLTIRGVARALDARDLIGMTCAGQAESHHRTYIVEMPNAPSATASAANPFMTTHPVSNGHGDLNDSIFATPTHNMHDSAHTPHIYPQPIRAYGTQEQMPSSFSTAMPASAPLSTDRTQAAPGFEPLPPWKDTSGLRLRSIPGRKLYCSYWLRHGECDYAQQGCLYLHEMPTDQKMLELLGHRDIPKWYQDKYGVLSFKAASASSDPAKDEGNTTQTSPPKSSSRTQGNWRSGAHRRGSSDERRGSGVERRNSGHERRSGGLERRRSGIERRENRPRNGDRRSPPRSSTRSSLAIRGRGPGSRFAASASTGLTATSSANGNHHHQSLLASEADKKTLAAIEADEYNKSRELEEAKRCIKYGQSPPAKYRLAESTPESSGGEEESADFEYSSK